MEKKTAFGLIDELSLKHTLSLSDYAVLLEQFLSESGAELAAYAGRLAVKAREPYYGKKVFIRGLIEISSICKNNCLYCGIRAGNAHAERYRLSPEEIFCCAQEGYALGFRTFVLQGGEDVFFTDEVLCPLLRRIKSAFPDCALTLSLGERSKESFERLFDAGADRYLLRHETATENHYKLLHPDSMSFSNRMQCLHNLRKTGYAVGAGFMVGSPFQTVQNLAAELKFIETFSPEMCGIGPFIPHKDTPFADRSAGSVDLTCFLLSLIRLIKPNILLPATTALGTLSPDGREKGIESGANVIMPNLSPVAVRKKYSLYDGKICTGEESAQCVACISRRMESIGYKVVIDRGDVAELGIAQRIS